MITAARWKLVNPYSIITQFDPWFEFEKECAFTPDGYLPDRAMRRLMAACVWRMT